MPSSRDRRRSPDHTAYSGLRARFSIQPIGLLLRTVEAALSRSGIRSALHSRAGRLCRSRPAGRAARRAHRPPCRDSCAPARRKTLLLDLVGQNAKQSYDQRFRVLLPSQKAIAEALQDALMLEEVLGASSASTSRISRARRRSPPWWCGKTVP